MRELIANIALTIYFISTKGDSLMMALLFAQKIILGDCTFEKVPAKLREQVAKILIDECDLPELVPTEYGGTAQAVTVA